ncbi:MAG: protein translocase SEC61 complex subunit gamma [Candidatus Bilamarchaeaceae archaeon]
MDIKELLRRIHRVLLIARKPTGEEFAEVAKVTGLGILLFGTVGLIIYVIFSLF